jgi:hypothetical protein
MKPQVATGTRLTCRSVVIICLSVYQFHRIHFRYPAATGTGEPSATPHDDDFSDSSVFPANSSSWVDSDWGGSELLFRGVGSTPTSPTTNQQVTSPPLFRPLSAVESQCRQLKRENISSCPCYTYRNRNALTFRPQYFRSSVVRSGALDPSRYICCIRSSSKG